MNYYIDTEFLEGTQKERFPVSLFRKNTPPTIDLISIGIVSEEGIEYYAISKDFNLKEAWNRYDEKVEIMSGDMRNKFPDGRKYKEYWIRENVLKPIFDELLIKYTEEYKKSLKHGISIGTILNEDFSYKLLKFLINRYGKTNKEIAKEIFSFTTQAEWQDNPNGKFLVGTDSSNEVTKKDLVWNKPTFYAYFADYDWVAFCWLFGKMMDLPTGYPMYCRDLKQMLDEKAMSYFEKVNPGEHNFKERLECIKNHPNYPKQENEHNALADARWNRKLHEFLNKL